MEKVKKDGAFKGKRVKRGKKVIGVDPITFFCYLN